MRGEEGGESVWRSISALDSKEMEGRDGANEQEKRRWEQVSVNARGLSVSF